jgi:DNA end-binding protein Ku
MLELANHIIETKMGKFDPASFDDRYEEALVELVKAKIEGKPLPKKKPAPEEKVVDLMQALRESAGLKKPTKAKPSKTAPKQRKAG